MLLKELHTRLMDSLVIGEPLIIEHKDMCELWNDIRQVFEDGNRRSADDLDTFSDIRRRGN